MDRTDPLDDKPSLTHRGPGHAPALWLALPLATIPWLSPSLALAIGVVGLAGAWVACGRSHWAWAACLLIAGAGLGAAWHGARAARRTEWKGERGQADLFVEVARVESREAGRWRLVGWVQTGPPDTARRRIVADGDGDRPAAGALQVLSGLLAPCGAEDEPREAWHRSQGITLRMGRARVAATIEPASAAARWLTEAAARIESGLTELAWDDPRGAHLLAATLLGRTRLLDEADRAAFATTGTLHLFAISGLHIAGMAVALAWLGRRLRIEPRLASLLALAALGFYVEATGGTPSARRAWIMAACILACTVARRKPNAVQGLAVACALTLVLDPEAAQDAGFQLSYASVLGILLAGGPAARALGKPGLATRLTPADARTGRRWAADWLRARTSEGLCISAAATTSGTAISLGAFGSLCPGGVLANLVLVPLSGPPVVLGMASIALLPFGWADGIRHLVNSVAATWLHAMAWLAEPLARVPGMSMAAHWRDPRLGAATACAVLLTLLLQPREPPGGRLLLRPALVLLAGLLLGANPS